MSAAPEADFSNYDAMWAVGQVELQNGQAQADAPPSEGGARWGVSVIARIPAESRALFTPLLHELSPLIGQAHTLYRPENLHTTLRTCEYYRFNIPAQDASIAAYRQVLNEIAPLFAPLRVRYCGLSANHTGVIAQGLPESPHFQQMRTLLQTRLAELGFALTPETPHLRQGAHVSLVVFGAPLPAPTALVEYIAARRRLPLGQVCFSEIELVHYKRSANSVQIHTLATVALHGQNG